MTGAANCGTIWSMSQRKQGAAFFGVLLALFLLVTPWARLGDASGDTSEAVVWCAANMVLMPLVALALIALEQAAVLVTARALGDHVLTITVGVGPMLWSRQFATRKIEVRLVPLAWTNAIISTRARGQRLRTTIATVAGLLVSAAPAVLWLAAFDTHRHASGVATTSRLAPEVLVVYVSFLAGGMTAVFVLGLLGNSSITSEQLKARRVLGLTLESSRYLMHGAFDEAVNWARRGLEESPDNALLQITLAMALSMRGDPTAFELTASLVKRELNPGLRALTLNVRAWECYLRGDDALRTEADDASSEAVRIDPDSVAFLDTRGHVALWQRRFAEAEDFLSRAYTKSAGSSGASAAAGLAMLCARTNRPDEAAQWLSRARASSLHHPVLARAVAEVEPLRRL